MKKETQLTIVTGHFNTKVGKKQMGETSVGIFGIDNHNSRGDAPVGFAERNNPWLMGTFSYKQKNRKWTWKVPDGTTKNEIDFILSEPSYCAGLRGAY